MHDTFEEILDGAGGTLLGERPGKDKDYGLNKPGEIIHEIGTTRITADQFGG